MQLDAAVIHLDRIVAGNGLLERLLGGAADALVGPLDAVLGAHIVFIRHIASQIGGLEGDGILHGKGLDGFHQVVLDLGGAVHGHPVKAQGAVPPDGVIVGLGVVIFAVRPAAGPGGGKAQLGIGIAVKEPEGHIHALDLVDVVLAAEHPGQQGLALEVFLQLCLGGLFVQLEGDDEVGPQGPGKLPGEDDGVAAEGAGGRRHGVVAHDLAAAALAAVSMQTGGLPFCPAAAGGGPLHLAGLFVLQLLVIALERIHVELGVAVGAFHLLGGAVKLDGAIAAGALVFQHSCHSVSSCCSKGGRGLFPGPAVFASVFPPKRSAQKSVVMRNTTGSSGSLAVLP